MKLKEFLKINKNCIVCGMQLVSNSTGQWQCISNNNYYDSHFYCTNFSGELDSFIIRFEKYDFRYDRAYNKNLSDVLTIIIKEKVILKPLAGRPSFYPPTTYMEVKRISFKCNNLDDWLLDKNSLMNKIDKLLVLL